MDRDLISMRLGVDHDPVDGTGLAGDATCLDYMGRTFPHCYDQHEGTDLILAGGWDKMDSGSTPVLAAYPGVVIDTQDGNYDRCHDDHTGISCDGHPIVPNFVKIQHHDGMISWYYHLKSGSVLVEPGDEVECGDPLGLVGSSGYSSMPHLHFEVRDPDDQLVDPFAGPYSQEESWWADQGSADGLPGDGCTAN